MYTTSTGSTSCSEQTEDVWLVRLDRWACLVVRGTCLALVLMLLVGLLMVYHEMLSAEWRIKASKLKLDQTYCRTEHVTPHEFQDVCVPARQVLERNAYLKAAEATTEWCMQRLPFVGYCRAHSDMCTLWGTKLVDVIDSLARWLPMLVPMMAPALVGVAWKLLTKPCRRTRRAVSTPPPETLKQIEGLKTE
jgi:hypothetical protein